MHQVVPEPVLRLRKFAGLVKGKVKCPPNPCITVREAIEIADYIQALEDRVNKHEEPKNAPVR